MTMTETIPNHELERQYTEGSLQEKPEIIEAEDDLVHPEFRLWLTTKTNVGLPLPAVLVQNGIKVACEAKENFRDSVRTNFHVVSGSLNNCTPVWGTAAESSVYKVNIRHFFFSFLGRLPSLTPFPPAFSIFSYSLASFSSTFFFFSSSCPPPTFFLLPPLFHVPSSLPPFFPTPFPLLFSIRFPILPPSARFFLHSTSFLIRFLFFIYKIIYKFFFLYLQLIIEVFLSIKFMTSEGPQWFLVLMARCRAYVLCLSSKPVSRRVNYLWKEIFPVNQE